MEYGLFTDNAVFVVILIFITTRFPITVYPPAAILPQVKDNPDDITDLLFKLLFRLVSKTYMLP